VIGLATLAVGYAMTRESAPSVKVRWRADVTRSRQDALERAYALGDRSGPDEDSPQTYSYVLRDTRRRNIESLVKDPAAADTSRIDRSEYVIAAGNQHGSADMWVADRLPGLRDTRVRAVVVLLCVLMSATGVPFFVTSARQWYASQRGRVMRAASALERPVAQAVRWIAGDTTDSSVLWWGEAIADSRSWAWKLAASALLLLVVGLPILSIWSAMLFATTAFALVFGQRRIGWRPLAGAGLVAIVVFAAKVTLPRADLAEAHNALIIGGAGEPLERGLPPAVFRRWKAEFDARYPSSRVEDSTPYAWRGNLALNVPDEWFTRSADAIWRRAVFTRQVDGFRFGSLGEFRAGFANESEFGPTRHANRYNFWEGSLKRDEMPFFVMYQLSRASVGSTIAWKGSVFWEKSRGQFDEVTHSVVGGRAITANDVDHRVYAAVLPGFGEDTFLEFQRSFRLRVSLAVATALTLIGALLVTVVMVRPRWPAYPAALALFTTGYVAIASRVSVLTGPIGAGYLPHGGGDDGLVHDGWGRMMAMLMMSGHPREALRGAESVYWFTPGMRYFRMVEKIFFGDTNHLYALALACVPVILFHVLQRLVRTSVALAIVALFCVIPFGNLAFAPYIAYAAAGYGEPIAAGLFLAGFAVMLLTQPSWGGSLRNLSLVFVAGAALAASMFIRPNFAFAVVWLGGVYALAAWKQGDQRRVSVFAAGLGLALWMPVHNLYYGHQFYLISKSGASISVPLSLMDYVRAARDILLRRDGSRAVALTSAQLQGWLGKPVFGAVNAGWLAGVDHVVNLVALFVCGWVALSYVTGRGRRPITGVIAITALCAHAPMLFIFDTNIRYAMLAWDLSLIATIAWAADRMPALVGTPTAVAVTPVVSEAFR
jgi:hypothetical protein